jgi:hypothetical protein
LLVFSDRDRNDNIGGQFSFQYVDEHRERGLHKGKEKAKALFFIVSPNVTALTTLARFTDMGLLQTFVAETYHLAKAKEAYERASLRSTGHGKVIPQFEQGVGLRGLDVSPSRGLR